MSSLLPIDVLLTRRSVVANDLCEPGPNESELDRILRAAHRVPDHKKLGPWRFIVFTGDARSRFGAVLKQQAMALNSEASDKLLEFEAQRFLRAPVVIAVVSSPVENPKAPEWEQVLSAGAACQNILLAATALGYHAQWLTEWYAYDEVIKRSLDIRAHEGVAGFMYIGSAKSKPEERPRPDLQERIRYW